MYFCHDVDLMVWEPAIFLDAAFSHQALFSSAEGTLTGTALVMDEAVLGDVIPGMVAKVVLADDSLTHLVEIVSVADTTHAVVSTLRGRSAEPAIAPLVGGSVKVTVLTFRPQIAATGDALLALLGVASDRDAATDPVLDAPRGFRTASLFGTLAMIFRTLSTAEGVTAAMLAKRDLYQQLAHQARRTLSARIDRDDDGTAETPADAAVSQMIRT